MSRQKKVLVSFPVSPAHPYLHKGTVHVSWKILSDKRYELLPIIPAHNPFENNLNKIVHDFISGGHDYWLSIDADNPPMRNPLDLIALDKDIIGCPTPVWHFTGNEEPGERPIYWNAYDYVANKGAYKPHGPMRGLQQVDAIGTGCFLVAKRVFEDKEMIGSFMRQWHEDGTVNKGNDISFSEKARIQGWEIWTHYDYPCHHFNEVNLSEVVSAINNYCEGIKK